MTTPKKGFSPIGWKQTLTNGTWWRTGTLAGSSALIKHQPNGLTWVILTNSSTWRGSDFTKDLSSLMRSAIRRVEEWPNRNLFDYYQVKPEIVAIENDFDATIEDYS